jgi:hypothetical protein
MVNIILKLASIFLFILPTLSALHAIHRFRMQFALKGIWLPLATALKGIRDPFARCMKVFDYRNTLWFSRIFFDFAILFDFRGFFFILHAVSNPFLQAAKRNLIPFGAETKGASNPFK